jgi:isoquinoline 1-oxidoreductase beta subunit
MTSTRRTFLRITVLAGAGIALELGCRRAPAPAPGAPAAADAPPPAEPRSTGVRANLWIELRDDGTVAFQLSKSEMGQGIRTALAMLVAEELDVDLRAVVPVPATTTGFFARTDVLNTESSASLMWTWRPLRDAAAKARALLVSAAAGLWGVARAECRTEAGAVHHAATGRRLAYAELLAAASRLPPPARAPLKDPRDFRLIGRPVAQLDAADVVTGAIRFSVDVRRPGQVFAAVARTRAPGGRLARFDDRTARALPGVEAVVPIPFGVAVVADTTWHALRGRDTLEVEFDESSAAGIDSAVIERALDAALEGPARPARSEGDVERGLALAARRLEATYATPFQVHAPMETPNAVAEMRDGGCEIWCGTQHPRELQRRAAHLLGVRPPRVVVHPERMGGAFGRKESPDFGLEAVAIARALGDRRPVQVIWSRGDDIRNGQYQPASRHRLIAGLGRDGILSWHHRVASPSINRQWYHLDPARRLDPHGETLGAWDMPYAIPAVRVDYAEIPGSVRLGYWRGIQISFNVFPVESFIDEIAVALGRDPIDLRRAALGSGRVVHHRKGLRVHVDRLRRVLDAVAKRSDWGSRLPAGRGRGVAATIFDGRTCSAMVAEVTVQPGSFKVDRIVCVIDCGLVVNPLSLASNAEGAVAWGLSALHSEITFAAGRAQQSNFADYPLLSLSQMPEVEIHTLPSSEPPTGTGEIPVPLVAPAVANALFAATGRRFRRLPIRTEDLT